jgi:hypothetical protein
MQSVLDGVASGSGPTEVGRMRIREHLPWVKTRTTRLVSRCSVKMQAFVETAPYLIRAASPPDLISTRCKPFEQRLMRAGEIDSD